MKVIRWLQDMARMLLTMVSYVACVFGFFHVFLLAKDRFIANDSVASTILSYVVQPVLLVLAAVGTWKVLAYTERKFIMPGHTAWLLRASQNGTIYFPDPDAREELAANLAEMQPEHGENSFTEICDEFDVVRRTHEE